MELGYMVRLDVSYDGGSWQTIFSNQTKDATGWLQSPFSSLGYHTISLTWYDIAGTSYSRAYNVYVAPQCQKFYEDNYGNTLTLWDGGNSSKVVLISEGFDAYNTTYSEYLRYKGTSLFDPFIQAGYKIYFLNYAYNGQDMRNSAAIFNAASRFISSLNSNQSMMAAGVSMGGVIVRYALAKAENDGNPLPFNKFVSIDAPQQGAVFDRPLQDYFAGQSISDFQRHGLKNIAAEQLLTYNAYGNLHSSFYNELNSLNNGRGYPTLTENIGVSFSNGTPNPGSGRWVVITYQPIILPGNYIVKTSDLYGEITVPGSYLPKSLVASDLSPFFLGMIEVDRDPNNNPTFIPYTSSLDLINGISKFNTTIQANSNYFHDQFPQEVVTALVRKLLPLSVEISGPTYIEYGTNGTWNATAIGGFQSYSYQWYNMFPSNNNLRAGVIRPNLPTRDVWFPIGTNSPTLVTSFPLFNGILLKCVVTDARGYTTTSNILSINSGTNPAKGAAGQSSLTVTDIPEEYSIAQNYPNPFNPTTIIKYQLPKAGFVTLKVYDVIGKEVKSLVDGFRYAGYYEASFNASNLASGMYFYQIKADNFISTKKMILTK